ncbi:hypothetical protein ABVT39_002192 [Epinephelus coioides]
MAVCLFEGKDHAAAYLQYRVAPLELISRIMGYMEKKTTNQFNLAVDVGCGSGQGTVLLAPYFTSVVGTDISPAQLEMAKAQSNPRNVSYKYDRGMVRTLVKPFSFCLSPRVVPNILQGVLMAFD